MKKSNAITGVVALMGIAPWAVFLGGLAKLTDQLTSYNFTQAVKQTVIMLEWYIVSAQLVNILLVLLVVIGASMRRAHTLLNMFLAVNTALLILQATKRIYQINRYQAGESFNVLLGVKEIDGNPLPYMRALAAGEVATAAWNFILAIMIGYSGTDDLPSQHARADNYKATGPITA